jgi:uncharacterized protein (TIGR00369 family)
MIEACSALEKLRAISKTSAFNEWLGLEVTAASEGRAELQLAWRSEFGQYAGFLHAGVMGALIDTACGFAAATITVEVLAAHNSVNFFRPAVATRFIALGKILNWVSGRSSAARRSTATPSRMNVCWPPEKRF